MSPEVPICTWRRTENGAVLELLLFHFQLLELISEYIKQGDQESRCHDW